MKIAIASYGFANWGGGIDFVRYIASAVASAANDHPRIAKTLILPADNFSLTCKNALYPIRGILGQLLKGDAPKWIARPGFSESYFKKNFSDLANDFEMAYSGSTLNSQIRTAQNLSADIVLPCIDVPDPAFSLPWVGYLYDFQHRYIPEFFTAKELESRDSSFDQMLNTAKHAIVNAKSVVHDAQHFHPGFSAKIHALPFSPCPQKLWLESKLDVRADYGIDKPYFILSNQFWKHKDHTTAFRAFARYVQGGGDALLVCTGQTTDYRFPQYFTELTKLIADLDVSSEIRILGHIPKIDQISLLKNALAVVQPTLFEGGPGGGASYDAIALGVPVIASDIRVNREMDCGDVTFFRVGDDVSLSDALRSRGSKMYVRPESALLLEQGLERRKRCGQVILDVVEQAIKGY